MAIFIRANIRKGIKVVDKTHIDIYCGLRFIKRFSNLNRFVFMWNLYFTINVIYISPKSSSYMRYTRRNDVDKSIFDKLDSDVIRFSCIGNAMTMGDLNVHINRNDHDF